MYRFDLAESYIPAQTDDVVTELKLETTVGGILRDAARQRGDAIALVEIDPPAVAPKRRWTFAELLADPRRSRAASGWRRRWPRVMRRANVSSFGRRMCRNGC